jgi:hypothetical protein
MKTKRLAILKYYRSEDDVPRAQPAIAIPLQDCDEPFSRGSVFSVRGIGRNLEMEYLFILTSSLGSSNLTWTSLTGYHSGDRTLLDFETVNSDGYAVDAPTLRTELVKFYSALNESQFDLGGVLYFDGKLELE